MDTEVSLLLKVLHVCRDNEYASMDEVFNRIPDADPEDVEQTLDYAVKRGWIDANVHRRRLLDGPIAVISNVRGLTSAGERYYVDALRRLGRRHKQ